MEPASPTQASHIARSKANAIENERRALQAALVNGMDTGGGLPLTEAGTPSHLASLEARVENSLSPLNTIKQKPILELEDSIPQMKVENETRHPSLSSCSRHEQPDRDTEVFDGLDRNDDSVIDPAEFENYLSEREQTVQLEPRRGVVSSVSDREVAEAAQYLMQEKGIQLSASLQGQGGVPLPHFKPHHVSPHHASQENLRQIAMSILKRGESAESVVSFHADALNDARVAARDDVHEAQALALKRHGAFKKDGIVFDTPEGHSRGEEQTRGLGSHHGIVFDTPEGGHSSPPRIIQGSGTGGRWSPIEEKPDELSVLDVAKLNFPRQGVKEKRSTPPCTDSIEVQQSRSVSVSFSDLTDVPHNYLGSSVEGELRLSTSPSRFPPLDSPSRSPGERSDISMMSHPQEWEVLSANGDVIPLSAKRESRSRPQRVAAIKPRAAATPEVHRLFDIILTCCLSSDLVLILALH